MRKSRILLASLSLFSLLIISGCKKDDDSPAKTKTQLLTQDLWKFDKATAGSVDISASISACVKDNNIIFDDDGTGEIVENPNICTPPASGNFVWTLQNGETRLFTSVVFFPGGGNEFTIVTLNDNTLELSQQMTIPPAPATTVTISLKH